MEKVNSGLMWFLGIFWVTKMFVIHFISVNHFLLPSFYWSKSMPYLWGISSYSRCTEISQHFSMCSAEQLRLGQYLLWIQLKWHVSKELYIERGHSFLLNKTLSECVWRAGAVLRTLEQTCLILDPRVLKSSSQGRLQIRGWRWGCSSDWERAAGIWEGVTETV